MFVLDFSDFQWSIPPRPRALEGFVEKLHHSGTSVYFAGARQSVRRTLLAAGLRRPLVRYAATAEDAISQWRSPLKEPSDGE